MNENDRNNAFDANLKRLLNSSVKEPDSTFESELIESVLEEVRRERRGVESNRLRGRRLGFAVAIAAVIVATVLLWGALQSVPGKVGLVRNVYGSVIVKNGTPPKTVTETAEILSGQWVETLSGSKAEIVLNDRSRLLTRPRTLVRIMQRKRGGEVLLEKGFLNVEAAGQPPGKLLAIETPGAKITVHGTELDVQVGQRPDGPKQTRVSVASGKVELEAAGEKVVLLREMEGIVEEGKPPVRRSITPEVNEIVNEMIRLIELNDQLAAQSNVPAGSPAIVDFNDDGTATVWTVASIQNATTADSVQYSLRGDHPAFRIKVFSLEGAALPVTGQGKTVHVDLSDAPVKPGQTMKIIVKVPDVRGLFRAEEGSVFEFDRPASASPVLTLFQFHLPESAHVEQICPAPIEAHKTVLGLVVTVASDSMMPELFN